MSRNLGAHVRLLEELYLGERFRFSLANRPREFTRTSLPARSLNIWLFFCLLSLDFLLIFLLIVHRLLMAGLSPKVV